MPSSSIQASTLPGCAAGEPGHDTIVFADDLDFGLVHKTYQGFDDDGLPIFPNDGISRGTFVIDSDVTIDATDNDFEMADTVRLALEKDPFVDASQVRVRTRNRIVRLQGLAPTEPEKEMAEADACMYDNKSKRKSASG